MCTRTRYWYEEVDMSLVNGRIKSVEKYAQVLLP